MMSKKHVSHEEETQEVQPVATTIHLRATSDLITPARTYMQGEVIEVTPEEAAFFYREYAAYFEVVPDVQKGE